MELLYVAYNRDEQEVFGLDKALIVTAEFDENLFLAARNLYKVEVCQPGTSLFNPVNLVGFEKVVMTSDAVKKVEEMLK